MARILISAGEASGDIHAAAVTRELKNIAPDTEVFGMGGDCLREAGGEVLFDIKEHGVMGFAEIVCKLPALFKLKKAFAKVMEERKPDCLVVVDYPGFNIAGQRGAAVPCAVPDAGPRSAGKPADGTHWQGLCTGAPERPDRGGCAMEAPSISVQSG